MQQEKPSKELKKKNCIQGHERGTYAIITSCIPSSRSESPSTLSCIITHVTATLDRCKAHKWTHKSGRQPGWAETKKEYTCNNEKGTINADNLYVYT